MSGYKARDTLLATLGYDSYSEYLSSPLWKRIREEVMRKNGRCAICRKEARVVHHIRYTEYNLSGKTNGYLRPLCHSCHRNVEFTSKGKKRRRYSAEVEYQRLIGKPRKKRKKKKRKKKKSTVGEKWEELRSLEVPASTFKPKEKIVKHSGGFWLCLACHHEKYYSGKFSFPKCEKCGGNTNKL